MVWLFNIWFSTFCNNDTFTFCFKCRCMTDFVFIFQACDVLRKSKQNIKWDHWRTSDLKYIYIELYSWTNMFTGSFQITPVIMQLLLSLWRQIFVHFVLDVNAASFQFYMLILMMWLFCSSTIVLILFLTINITALFFQHTKHTFLKDANITISIYLIFLAYKN